MEIVWSKTEEKKEPTGKLWLYDAGQLQGLLLERKDHKTWHTWETLSREFVNDTNVIEKARSRGEASLFKIFGVSEFPMAELQTDDAKQQAFWIPGWRLTLRYSQPSPPEQPVSLKSHSVKPAQIHPSSHNKRTDEQSKTARSSGNQTPRGQPPPPHPRKSAASHPGSRGVPHSASSQQQWFPLSQISSLPLQSRPSQPSPNSGGGQPTPTPSSGRPSNPSANSRGNRAPRPPKQSSSRPKPSRREVPEPSPNNPQYDSSAMA